MCNNDWRAEIVGEVKLNGWQYSLSLLNAIGSMSVDWQPTLHAVPQISGSDVDSGTGRRIQSIHSISSGGRDWEYRYGHAGRGGTSTVVTVNDIILDG